MKRIIVTREPLLVDYMVETEGDEGPGIAFLLEWAVENPDTLRRAVLDLARQHGCTHIFDPLIDQDLPIEQYTAPIIVEA